MVEGDSEFLECLDERNPEVVVYLDRSIVFRFVIL